MATNVTTAFSRMMKSLRENSGVKEKREALTYIASQAKKLESSGVIKEERYKELCKLVIEAFTKEEGSMQYEALGALTAIVQEFQTHSLHLFESMLRTDKRIRLKILKLLEVVEDNAISAAANDWQALNFFKDCLASVQPNVMEWITPTACVDNLQLLTKVEHHVLSDEQKLEEDTIIYSLTLLRRLYRLTAVTCDSNIEKFDTLLMDKIATLAYMGHKRQRSSALKVLQQAIATNIYLRIRQDHPDLWAQYKYNLQLIYCKRMMLLVAACETDWSIQWNITIQLLGTDLHRGASLINNLLSVEEKAFKSTDTIIRRQAFLSWKLLIDNFALDQQELATARRIKLLCIPLNAKNSKTELIALTKLEVWWHLIIKLYKDITQFVTPVITQFLNFCFGPLGDTPLLSPNFDAVASPGKRFLKTKLVAVDALYQLIVPKEEGSIVCAAMLEERLPHAMSHEVFQQCSKNITHSIGEALLILGQLVDQEMKNRYQLGKILWTSLITYIRDIKLETKDYLYRDVILVVTELENHFDKTMVKDMFFDVILPDIVQIVETTGFIDSSLPKLISQLLSFPILCDISQNLNCNKIECLLQKCVNSEIMFSSGVLGFLQNIMLNLKSASDTHKNTIFYVELWAIIAKALTEYIANSKKIDEGDKNGHNFKTVKSVLSFPFQYTVLENSEQVQNQVTIWKALYKEFETHSDSISTVKPNEIVLDTANIMQTYLNENNCSFIVLCLEALSNTINYENMSAQDGIPSILQLMLDVATIALNNLQSDNCEVVLKILSVVLITVYRHDSQKTVLYLQKCKSVIELALKLQLKTLYKEVASIWETVVSIFKGLDKQLHRDLFVLYKEVFLISMYHSKPDVQALTRSIFDIKDGSNSAAKYNLDVIGNIIEKSISSSKSDSATKKKEETGKTKEVRIAGSFLNRKTSNTKTVSNKTSEKEERKIIILPEPDSQDYIYIKTDLKFDINRLTEHQKETLKKKREDIPALYNDLSQSSSQNSQNLQEWFDIKAKHINESDKASNKKSDFTQKPINGDANKENNIIVVRSGLNLRDNIVNNNNSSKLDGNVGDNIVDVKQKEDSTKEAEKTDSSSHDENTSQQSVLPSSLTEFTGLNVTSETHEDPNVVHSTASIAKKLNFESMEEFPEDERQSSPSMFDSDKRRHRSDILDMTRSNSSLTGDEGDESRKDSSATNIAQRTAKTRNSQEKPSTSGSQKPFDNTGIKEDSNENKKGVKRKYALDAESDGGQQQRRRRKLTQSAKDDDDKVRDSSDGSSLDATDVDSLSQRMKNEMSRLKIDMVFDCPAVNRRRSKHSEESDKETSVKKSWTLDDKSLKLKYTEVKSAEAFKKSLKTTERNTKDGKDGSDTSQGTLKRRGRRSTRIEPNKTNSDVIKEVKTSNDTNDKSLPSKNSVDTVTTKHVAPMTSQAVEDVADGNKDENPLDKDDSKSVSNKNADKSSKLPESNESNQDEMEDVVESSQAFNADIIAGKICGEKHCYIKINKITNADVDKASDVIVEKNHVPESIPVDCGDNDVPGPCEQSNQADIDNNKESDVENKDSASKDAAQEADTFNEKTPVSEGHKAADSSLSIKPTGATSFSSPKSSGKVFSKLKSFTSHGRAAHMLGLVTKQSRVETDGSIVEDDPSPIKKTKSKDTETETPMSKKATSTAKEIDKIGGPSGSRQEKIFNNMRSSDYCNSSSTYGFTNLKNDGEKLPSNKVEKNTSDSMLIDSSVDKDNEETSSHGCEKDDPLPMVWFVPNPPPSPSASPSASILKRHRSIGPEPDTDSTTPNKRKRVSFADPPVSKEVSYEISTTESPHKSSKCSAGRSCTLRKDSPFRSKQLKFRVSTDTEKSTTENEAASESSALQAEKSTESMLLSVVHSVNMDHQYQQRFRDSSENVVEKNLHAEANVDSEEQEVEITIDAIDVSSVSVPEKVSEDKLHFLTHEIFQRGKEVEYVETEETETQEDIFDGSESKKNNPPKKSDPKIQVTTKETHTSVQNNSVDAINLNETNDSVINALSIKEDNLEDTVDIQNVIGLNSMNSDDAFYGKLSCNNTQMKNLAEQDTLSVSDSIVVSLPSSQDSRCDNQNNVELDPEYLDSIQPIYPELSSCREPIDSIVEMLTTPLWKQNLNSYLTSRNLFTIGDLAQLSEREVNRMPLKGKPKIEFVRKVLRHYENVGGNICHKEGMLTSKYTSRMKSSDKDESTIVSVIPVSDSIEVSSASIKNESLSCSTPLAQPPEKLDNLSTEKSFTEYLNRINSTSSDLGSVNISSGRGSSDLLASDISAENGKTSNEVILVVSSSAGKSMSHGKPMTLPLATSSISKDHAIISGIPSSSDNINVSNLLCDEPFITHSSIGVGTDEAFPSEPVVRKTTRSVESQMALEDLLDEIDVNVVLESAIRRCNPETIMSQYRMKMRHLTETELVKETVKILGVSKRQQNDSMLRTICHSYGINNVLLRLPDVFNSDKQFFDRVFKAYYKKLDLVQCLQVFDYSQLKNAICQKCTSSELIDMLSEKLKQEDQEGIKKPIPEVSSLSAMLQRLPMDMIISHTVANEDLIPSSVVLDIAMQNNSTQNIARVLNSQSSSRIQSVLEQVQASQSIVGSMENLSKESLLDVFERVSSKLSAQELLDGYHQAMASKLLKKE